MQIRFPLGIFVFALASIQLADAQLSADTAQGLSPYAVYKAGGIDNVNPANGNLFLDIPLISFPQRGNALRLAFHIYSNDKQWYIGNRRPCNQGASLECGNWAGPVFTKGEVGTPAVGAYVARDQQITFGWDDDQSVTTIAAGSCGGSDYQVCTITTDLYGFYAISSGGAKHYIADQQNQSCSSSGGGSCPSTYSNYDNYYPAPDGSNYVPRRCRSWDRVRR